MVKKNGLYSPTDSIKGFIPQIIDDFICDYCGEECDGNHKFKIFVNEGNGNVDDTAISCPGCIATFFTETPEDVLNMRIIKLEAI